MGQELIADIVGSTANVFVVQLMQMFDGLERSDDTGIG